MPATKAIAFTGTVEGESSHGLVRGAAVASIWPGERLWKKAWVCWRRPGQLTAVLATQFFSPAPRCARPGCPAGCSGAVEQLQAGMLRHGAGKVLKG